MSIQYRFLEPLDVLFLRGNKLFGDPGSYGECLIPPWPSVAAGAIRSRMLVDEGIDLAAFAGNQVQHAALGTPAEPGSFTLAGFSLARKTAGGAVEQLWPMPADVVISRQADGSLSINRMRPQAIGLVSSFPLPQLPVLAQAAARSKPETGYWLTAAGWQAYLQGAVLSAEHLVHSASLWSMDARVGIGMDAATRSVEEGKLFTTQAVAMQPGVGFVAGVTEADVPNTGLVRLGGDGRAAAISAVVIEEAQTDYESINKAGRCVLVLTSPGLFAEGWLPAAFGDNQQVVLPGNIKARLVSAALPRSETLSGWDLASNRPKAAQKIVPAGSLYWLEDVQASAEQLEQWVTAGLWDSSNQNDARRAEGFNRFALGVWA